MTLLAIGVNYRTAPLALRERLAIAPRELPEALAQLRRYDALAETALLSTCNRTELYVASRTPWTARVSVREWLVGRSRLPSAQLAHSLYELEGEAAAGHLFRVAAGLDSMVLGESEIVAQVKSAYQTARTEGAAGAILHSLFQKALHAAKLVRTKTAIGRAEASIGSVVVALARRHAPQGLDACDVLLWGTGKAAEVTARHLMKQGVRHLAVVSRTPERAQELAVLCRGGWLSWQHALPQLARVDVAIVCTQAPHYVVDAADWEAIRPQRRRPLLLIDLAVPRNVDPSLRGVFGITVYDIDDLHTLAREGVESRKQAVQDAEALIREQAGHYWRKIASGQRRSDRSCRIMASDTKEESCPCVVA